MERIEEKQGFNCKYLSVSIFTTSSPDLSKKAEVKGVNFIQQDS